jgi:phosphoribosylformylglycinamidine cyclo-ligase
MPNLENPISYSQAGVNYDNIDPLKRVAQLSAKSTAVNLNRFGMQELGASRGESAYVWEETECYRALVVEGLGTKNLVADEMRKHAGKTYYDQIAQDTVAMIVNDLIVVGADPQVVNAYFAIGSSEWIKDEERARDLVGGWTNACNLAGAVWGGGETPVLKGIISPETIDLAGSAVGIIKPKERLVLGDKLTPGDVILLIESNGIHSNGLTLVRAIAATLPKGYATPLDDGTLYGEALLAPTHIYASLVRKLFEAGIDIHYMVNITGHGWRKLMRANRDFTYIVDQIPEPQLVFRFIQKNSGNSDEEMYGNFNMGSGFAIFIPDSHALKAKVIASLAGYHSVVAGRVEEGEKQVIIRPTDIVFKGESLGVR